MDEILYCKYADGRYCRNEEIDRLRAENEALRKYEQVIDEALIVRHLGVAKNNPREELHAIINYDLSVDREWRGWRREENTNGQS
jgi:hypothetical protein